MRVVLFVACITSIIFGKLDCAVAHFGMVIPSQNILTQENRTVALSLSFSHPFEKIGMNLAKPEKFYVIHDKQKTNLLPTLKEAKIMNHEAWETTYRVKRPGVYSFVMEPTPYWEPMEDVSIIHYTKTMVAAYGAEEGWGDPLGLPTEIVPLLRPFGNYAGNSFTGKVLKQGKPQPHAEVEVEFYNRNESLKAPSDYHITQVVTADKNGVFSFSCPLQGWWGFAALSKADYTLNDSKGIAKEVELGAVLWIYLNGYQMK